ncbi:MAG TPA: hypothetical protein VJJ20_03490 [Candidatus Paceibacterota bacterium]
MDFKKLSNEEVAALETFLLQSQAAERAQAQDLIQNCHNKFQFAKTYSVYIEDWEKTKATMLAAVQANKLPPSTSKEFMENMLEISEGIIQDKLNTVRSAFEQKFGESIFNYLGPDGKRKKLFGIF